MKDLKKRLLSKTLGKHAYWTVNKSLAKSIGLESALILQHIIDLQNVFDKDEIFQSQPDMAEELGISEYAVRNRIPELIKLGLLNVVKKGVPCKNYYSTNDNKIMEIIVNGLDTTKSTDLTVDLPIEQTSGIENNTQLVSNQQTGDIEIVETSNTEIGVTITNNTNQEDKQEYFIKNTDIKEADKRLTKIIELMSSDYPSARKLLSDLEEDYKGLDNCLKIAYPNDTSAQSKWKGYLFNLTIK
jgi:DNA-binding Lrp family transcriptional regulator